MSSILAFTLTSAFPDAVVYALSTWGVVAHDEIKIISDKSESVLNILKSKKFVSI